jgi:hypothetical protein
MFHNVRACLSRKGHYGNWVYSNSKISLKNTINIYISIHLMSGLSCLWLYCFFTDISALSSILHCEKTSSFRLRSQTSALLRQKISDFSLGSFVGLVYIYWATKETQIFVAIVILYLFISVAWQVQMNFLTSGIQRTVDLCELYITTI